MAERSAASRKAYRRGHHGEWLAAAALMLKGYRILARRYRTRLGEIDLIARRGDLVLIVEVKARRTLMEAMEAIGHESERRIEAAADFWLSRQSDYGRLSVRFDMVAVLPWRWPVHVENAWAELVGSPYLLRPWMTKSRRSRTLLTLTPREISNATNPTIPTTSRHHPGSGSRCAERNRGGGARPRRRRRRDGDDRQIGWSARCGS